MVCIGSQRGIASAYTSLRSGNSLPYQIPREVEVKYSSLAPVKVLKLVSNFFLPVMTFSKPLKNKGI